MKYLVAPLSIGLVLLFWPASMKAEPTRREIHRIEAATRLFNSMPEKIPPGILENAKGIAVIPGQFRVGFIYGVELGGGVLVARLPDGSWSLPAFTTLAGASFGLQIGGEARDIFLVFNSTKSMDNIESGWTRLGAGISVAAGPVGKNVAAATDSHDVFSYISSAGAYVGATVEGSILSFDFDSNRDLYGVADPLKMQVERVPEQAAVFSCAVSKTTGAPADVCDKLPKSLEST
jgi:lipid-binding SYLF domain-containing protein